MMQNDSTQFQPIGANMAAPAARQSAESQVVVDWNVGDVILDTYEVTGLLGEGGMGQVYKVHHKGWNTDLAVKSPKSEILAQAGGVENFVRECETWVNLGLHPHIVSCYYVRTLGGIPRVFAEYVAGGSLKDWIDERKLYEGGPEKALERILDVAIQFAWGLHYAHEQGLVHQDVKPANVMLTPDGMAKVTDFGLAKARGMAGDASMAVGQSILVSTGGMTPAYCSPEQAQHQPLMRKTDIWSWGVSVLEMFVGEVTWLAGQAAAEALAGYLENGLDDKTIPAMPAELADLLGLCFQEEVEARPKDLHEIATLLQQVYARATERSYSRQIPQASELQADGLNNQALSLHDLGRTAEANALWKINLQTNPWHLETTYNLGLVQWRAGQKDYLEVLGELRAAAVSHEDWRLGWLTSQAHLERGDVTQALMALETLPREAGTYPEVIVACRQAADLESVGYSLSRTFGGHTNNVLSVYLSGDGRHALSGSIDKTLKLWDVATGACVQTLAGHTDWVLSVCLSGDGRYALSGSRDNTLKLWELSTGMCVQTLAGHTSEVKSVCLSRDGRYALSGSDDKTLKLWEVETGQCVQTLAGHTGSVHAVCLSQDGRYALSGSWDITLKLWDVATGKCVRTFAGHAQHVDSVCLSADGRYALSASKKTLKLWEVATGQCVRTFTGHKDDVRSACLSSNWRYALSASDDQTLKLWEVATGRCVRTLAGHKDQVNAVCLSGDGRYALSGSKDGTLKLWELAPGYMCRAPFAVSRVVTSQAAVTVQHLLAEAQAGWHCGEVVLAARALRHAMSMPGYEHNAEIKEAWSRLYQQLRRATLRSGWLLRTLEGHADSVLSVGLSRDGQYALSGSADRTLKLWEAATGKCVRTFVGHTQDVLSVCLSVDGRYALSGSRDEYPDSKGARYSLKLWDAATGACVRTLVGHTGGVNSVCLSADGRYALSGSWDHTLKLWEVATGQCVRTFVGHTSSVMPVCLSADGRYAFSGSIDSTLKFWEVATGDCVRTFAGQTGPAPVYSVCLSADGRYALSGSDDKTLKLWDVATGECVRTFQGHTQRVLAVCLSADGQYALSGSSDSTLKLWEVTTGACVRTLEGHTGEVNAVRLTADGRYALSGSSDKTLKLWELDWELEDHEPAEWDEGARPYLQNFLALHRPYAGQLAQGRSPTDEEVTQALSRRGQPEWNAEDFQQLLGTLGCAGYGWLRPEGVRRELERMAKKWKGPPPL